MGGGDRGRGSTLGIGRLARRITPIASQEGSTGDGKGARDDPKHDGAEATQTKGRLTTTDLGAQMIELTLAQDQGRFGRPA